jgi:uncharacterized damage-inducible protein DinB
MEDLLGEKLEISVCHDGAWRIETEAIRDYYYPPGFRARLSPEKRHWSHQLVQEEDCEDLYWSAQVANSVEISCLVFVSRSSAEERVIASAIVVL